MNHSQDRSIRPLNEGEAIRIGPVRPGETDDEIHVYIDPQETQRTLKLTHQVEQSPFALNIQLTLENVQPDKEVLLGLRLMEEDENRQEHSRGYRLVLLPAHREAFPCSVDAPSIRFLLGRKSEEKTRHFILRVRANYAKE